MPGDFIDYLLPAGRVLMGGAFLIAGLRNLKAVPFLSDFLRQRGMPFPRLATCIGIAMEILGGAALVAGLWVGVAAAVLILFLVLATVLFHNFWAFKGEERVAHINAFISNTALAGGFLMAMASIVWR